MDEILITRYFILVWFPWNSFFGPECVCNSSVFPWWRSVCWNATIRKKFCRPFQLKPDWCITTLLPSFHYRLPVQFSNLQEETRTWRTLLANNVFSFGSTTPEECFSNCSRCWWCRTKASGALESTDTANFHLSRLTVLAQRRQCVLPSSRLVSSRPVPSRGGRRSLA